MPSRAFFLSALLYANHKDKAHEHEDRRARPFAVIRPEVGEVLEVVNEAVLVALDQEPRKTKMKFQLVFLQNNNILLGMVRIAMRELVRVVVLRLLL